MKLTNLIAEFQAYKVDNQLFTSKTLLNHQLLNNAILLYFSKIAPLLTVNEVNFSFADSLVAYLQKIGYAQVYQARIISHLSETLRFACKKSYIQYNPLSDYQISRGPQKSLFLPEQKVFTSIFDNYQPLSSDLVNDVFVFLCLTGMCLSDVRRYKIQGEWLTSATDKTYVVFLNYKRTKNSAECWLPVSEFTYGKAILTIHDKYAGNIPRIKSAVFNDGIRLILSSFGYKNYFNSTYCRKVFATLSWNAGWNSEALKAFLGHSSITTTERYYIKQTRARLDYEILKRKSI